MTNYLVISCRESTWIPEGKDQEIKTVKIEYLDLASRLQEKIDIGFEVLDRNVYKDGWEMDDFPEIPGVYNFEFEQTAGNKKKIVSKLVNVELVKKVKFKKCPTNEKAVIILHAHKLDFKTKDGGAIRGLQLFYIQPWNEEPQVLKYFDKQLKIIDFSYTPSFHELSFKERRLGEGKTKMVLDKCELIEPITTNFIEAIQ